MLKGDLTDLMRLAMAVNAELEKSGNINALKKPRTSGASNESDPMSDDEYL